MVRHRLRHRVRVVPQALRPHFEDIPGLRARKRGGWNEAPVSLCGSGPEQLGENKLVDIGKLFLAQLSGVVQFL